MDTNDGTPCNDTSDIFSFIKLIDNSTNAEAFTSYKTFAIKNDDEKCVNNSPHH